MRVDHPTHVVTVGVWCPEERTTDYFQAWVDAGPFPAGSLRSLLLHALQDATEGRVELVEARTSTTSIERAVPAPWEQLSLPNV